MSAEDTWNLIRDLSLRPVWDQTVSKVDRDENLLHYVAPLFLGLSWYWTGEYITFEPPKDGLYALPTSGRSAIKMIYGSITRPFKSLVGTWIVTPRDDRNAMLTMNISFEPRIPIPLLDIFMRGRVKKLLRKSLSKLSSLASELNRDGQISAH